MLTNKKRLNPQTAYARSDADAPNAGSSEVVYKIYQFPHGIWYRPRAALSCQGFRPLDGGLLRARCGRSRSLVWNRSGDDASPAGSDAVTSLPRGIRQAGSEGAALCSIKDAISRPLFFSCSSLDLSTVRYYDWCYSGFTGFRFFVFHELHLRSSGIRGLRCRS